MDDSELLELVRRHRGPAVRLAASILGPAFAHEAEDVAQDAFARAFSRLEGFRGEAKFGTWLYRIVYNVAIDRKRSARSRWPHVAVDAAHGLAAPEPEDRERERMLLECVEALPDLYQTVIRLHYWMGAGIGEIAEYLEAPEGTVKSYLHRARARLERMMEERERHG